MAAESRQERSYHTSSSARKLRVITFRVTLDVPMELLFFVIRLLILERRRRCTPAGSRALNCREQAVMVLRRFRDQSRAGQLGRDHGISRATTYRNADEGTEMLAARAPDLHEARWIWWPVSPVDVPSAHVEEWMASRATGARCR